MMPSPYLSVEQASDPGADDKDVERILAQVDQQATPALSARTRNLLTRRRKGPPDLRFAPPVRNDIRRDVHVQAHLDAPTRASLLDLRVALASEMNSRPFMPSKVLRIAAFCLVERAIEEGYPALPTPSRGESTGECSVSLDGDAFEDLKQIAEEAGRSLANVLRDSVTYLQRMRNEHGIVSEVRVGHFTYQVRKRTTRLILDYLNGLGRPATEDEIVEAVAAVPWTEGFPPGEYV